MVKIGFFALFLLLFSSANQIQANPLYASIVVDADTGEVLHESRADASRYPASLTKMMTLYMLFETLQQGEKTLESKMEVSSRAASMPQTNINLKSGDTISVDQAILALIVRSANDVAVVVAESLGGSEIKFGHMMTDKARQLGMRSTTFLNASGLPNHKQTTTARDMVILSARLQKDFPQYYHYFSTQSFKYNGVTYSSHNRMVRNTEGVDGMKTGYIRASGFNVATSAKRGDRRVIAVVMGGRAAATRDRHMASLLDRTFANMKTNNRHTSVHPVVNLRVGISVPVPRPKPGSSSFQLVPDSKPTANLEFMPEPIFLPEGEADPTVIGQATHSEVHVNTQKVSMVDSNHWAVQIGTFLAYDSAQTQSQVASFIIAAGDVVITEVETGNRKLYRARLEGLHEDQARKACQNLVRQGMECLVVQ
ncbi:MAG: D-alanyl-D-alanine carboxypeptidase [Nitrosomonas sp.]|nr:D-alanyl-D-alanine carboxypeptidase [Nitrosomonas sp.]